MANTRAPVALWRSVRTLPEFRRLLEVRTVSQFGDGLFQAGLAGAILFNPDRAAAANGDRGRIRRAVPGRASGACRSGRACPAPPPGAMRSPGADMAAECLMACLSLGCGELPLRLLVERDVGGGEVLLQMRHRGGAGYQQDVGRQAQGPGQRDLGRGGTEPSRRWPGRPDCPAPGCPVRGEVPDQRQRSVACRPSRRVNSKEKGGLPGTLLATLFSVQPLGCFSLRALRFAGMVGSRCYCQRAGATRGTPRLVL